MPERWVKRSDEFAYIYDINRAHNTATFRIIQPDGSMRTAVNATNDLLDGSLTEEDLTRRGYQRVKEKIQWRTSK